MPEVESNETAKVEEESQPANWWHDRERLAEARKAAHDRLTGTDWSAREAELIARDRAELMKQRETEEHDREQRDFIAHAKERHQQARWAGLTGEAEHWRNAAQAMVDGKWPISRIVSADPAIGRFQGLRTRLNYRGANVRLQEE